MTIVIAYEVKLNPIAIIQAPRYEGLTNLAVESLAYPARVCQFVLKAKKVPERSRALK
jgi:hypothetical protein